MTDAGSAPARIADEFRHVYYTLRTCWRPGPWLSIGLLTLAVVSGIATPLSAGATRSLIDALTTPRSAGRAYLATAIIAGCAVLIAVLPVLQRALQSALTRAVTLHTNEQLYTAMGSLPGLAPFESPAFRDQLRLAQQASASAPPQILSAALACLQSVATLVSFLILLGRVNPVIAVGTVAAAVPVTVASLLDAGRQANYLIATSARYRRSSFFASLLVDVQAVKEIRLYQLNDFFKDRMIHELSTIQDGERRLDRAMVRQQGSLVGLSAATGGAFLIWSVHQAAAGRLSIGNVALIMAGITGIQVALVGLIARFSVARQAAILFKSFRTICAGSGSEPAPPTQQVRAGRLSRGIEVEGVWFRYPDAPSWALRDVTLRIGADESIALVGDNGAGKSTLVKLLCRLYEPTRGRILWNGVDIRCYPIESLRAEIGAVFQDFMTYDLTVTENVGIGDLGRLNSAAAVRTAASHAGAAEFIARLPAGYDTMLSRVFGQQNQASGTAFLSGGQWQRLALARAFMRTDRSLLILDEPSSGLDPDAEARVHGELIEAARDRASVLISHRLAAVRMAQTIYVLADGRICESGSHESLMDAQGRYWQLFTKQASGYLTP
jgi:ATP-binding cassette, subfamily B, bacterial